MYVAGIECQVFFIQKENESPLYWASQNGHVEVVKLLLEANADVECTRSNVSF